MSRRFRCPRCSCELYAEDYVTGLEAPKHLATRWCRAEVAARELYARGLAPFPPAVSLPVEVPWERHETHAPLELLRWGVSPAEEVEEEYGQVWAPLWAKVTHDAVLLADAFWGAGRVGVHRAVVRVAGDPELAAAVEAVFRLGQERERARGQHPYNGSAAAVLRGAAELLTAALRERP